MWSLESFDKEDLLAQYVVLIMQMNFSISLTQSSEAQKNRFIKLEGNHSTFTFQTLISLPAEIVIGISASEEIRLHLPA